MVKIWPHLLVITLLVIFLFISPRVNDRYFVKQGKPVAVDIELPIETNAAQSSVDGLKPFNQQGVYQLSGWAFPTVDKSLPASDYERQVVLESSSGNYVYQADTTLRLDIQAAFNHLGMNISMSGLSALIFKESVPIGNYRLGLIFKNTADGSAYYVSLNGCISRTPNRFHLVGMESKSCRKVTHFDGIPVQVNIPLPIETPAAKFHIDSFTALDDQDLYQLSGWAFPVTGESIPSSEYDRFIILCSNAGNYMFKVEAITRADVQNTFKDLGIDVTKTGFSTVISKQSLDIGSYELGFIYKHSTSGETIFFNSTVCITNNSEGLTINEKSPGDCTISTP